MPSEQYSLELTDMTLIGETQPTKNWWTEDGLVVGYTGAITRHQYPINYCVWCVVCGVWITVLLLNIKYNTELHLSLQNILFRTCFHDDTTNDWSYARLPSILTQTNNRNIQVHY